MDTLFTILIGIGLRLLVPIGITILIFFLLRRLDARWQKDALNLPVVPVFRKPCWEAKDCPEKMKKSCPAFAQSNMPCWQVFRQRDGLLKETCLVCEVFRQAPLPSNL
jgi:hypothetical protein